MNEGRSPSTSPTTRSPDRSVYFPPELIDCILSHCIQVARTFSTYSLVARVWRHPAQRILLSEVRVYPALPSRSFSSLLSLLAIHPDLALYIRTVATLLPFREEVKGLEYYNVELHELRNVLSRLPQLRAIFFMDTIFVPGLLNVPLAHSEDANNSNFDHGVVISLLDPRFHHMSNPYQTFLAFLGLFYFIDRLDVVNGKFVDIADTAAGDFPAPDTVAPLVTRIRNLVLADHGDFARDALDCVSDMGLATSLGDTRQKTNQYPNIASHLKRIKVNMPVDVDEVSPLRLHSCQQLETLMLMLTLLNATPLLLDRLWQSLAGTLMSLPLASALPRFHIILRSSAIEHYVEDDEHDDEPEMDVRNSWDAFVRCLQRFKHLSVVDIDVVGEAVESTASEGPAVDLHPTLTQFFGQTGDDPFPTNRTYDATIRILDDYQVEPRYDL